MILGGVVWDERKSTLNGCGVGEGLGEKVWRRNLQIYIKVCLPGFVWARLEESMSFLLSSRHFSSDQKLAFEVILALADIAGR